MVYINAIGIFETLITAFLLRINLRQHPASTYLLLFVICLMAQPTSDFLLDCCVGNPYLKHGFFSFIALAYGPLLWAFTRKLTNAQFSAAASFFSFLPVCIFGVVYLIIVGRCIENPNGNFKYIKFYDASLTLLLAAINIPFSLTCLRISRTFNKELTEEKQLIRLLSWTIIILMSLTFIYTFVTVCSGLTLDSFHIFNRSLIAFGLIFSCLCILKCRLYSIKPMPSAIETASSNQTLRLVSVTDRTDPDEFVTQYENIGAKNMKPGLINLERQAEIFRHLDNLMCEQKLFLDPDLNMEKLMHASNISRHYISEVLNNYANKPFYHFINEYRVNMVCEQMRKTSYQSSVITLEFLGKTCGFKSKTSFNEYFKKIKGLTPSEYWKKLVAENISGNEGEKRASLG